MNTNKGNRLGNEQILGITDYLESPNKKYKLLLHESGCLQLLCTINYQILWSSNSFSEEIDAVRMQADGNLVVYKKGGKNAAWASNTNDWGGDYLELEDNGNLVICKKDRTIIWCTGTYKQEANMLLSLYPNLLNFIHNIDLRHLISSIQYEQTIRKNEYLLSANGKYKLLLTEKGNLILYDKDGHITWASNTEDKGATELRMQADGNLVLYKKERKDPVWATGTNGPEKWGSRLVLENYGHLVLYDKDGHIAWTSHNIDTSNWMTLLDDSLSLKQICIPGSHDAGMYSANIPVEINSPFVQGPVKQAIDGAVTLFAKGLAQTQHKNIYEQLKSGVRYFDIRAKLYQNEFYIYHGPAYGPMLKTVLADINKFREEAKGETIILNFSHFERFDSSVDAKFVDELAASFKTEYLFDVEKHKNAAGVYNHSQLFDFPLSELRGKIILLIEDNSAMYNNEVMAQKRKGIYYLFKGNQINADAVYTVKIFDQYADKEVCEEMVKDQSAKFGNFNNNEELFLLNWTLTASETAIKKDLKDKVGIDGEDIIGTIVKLYIGAGLTLPIKAGIVKTILIKHSVETFARSGNHRLLGDRQINDFVFAPNKHGKMVNIINTDFVDWVNGVRACLRVMSA